MTLISLFDILAKMKQKTALEILKTGRNAFLTGAAGTGKTHVLKEYIAWLRKNNITVAVTASTGIAATHLSGQTIHAWSGIGIKDYLSDWDLDAMTQKQALVTRLRSTSVLIIDEISMLAAHTLENLNTVLKLVRQDDKPFGGLQIVLSGDFFQLPPVARFSGDFSFDFESIFAFSAPAWHEANLKILYLDEQYRQKDELVDILNAIRRQELDSNLLDKLKSRVGIKSEQKDILKLHTHNTNVDQANEEHLSELDGKIYEYPMILSGNKAKAENMARNVLAPELLRLKEGARVMFVKNDPQGTYVNGSLGTVIGFRYNMPEVLLDNGKTMIVEKSSWEMENENGKILARAEQLPLRLAWAITIHKSQGMSMDSAEMNLSKVFAKGQGYVALSRVRSIDGLFIEAMSEKALHVSDAIFEFDQALQRESKLVSKLFESYSENKKADMIQEFISQHKKNGTVTKIATHLQSLQMLNLNSIKKIAKERDLKESTIIAHLEKAQKEGIDFDISELAELKGINLHKIFSTFEELGHEKLSPVFQKLKGKYDFDKLRLARIAYLQQN